MSDIDMPCGYCYESPCVCLPSGRATGSTDANSPVHLVFERIAELEAENERLRQAIEAHWVALQIQGRITTTENIRIDEKLWQALEGGEDD